MSKQTYKEYQEDLKAEQAGLSKEEIKQALEARKTSDGKPYFEHIADLDNLPAQNHLWTDRGLKYTCENAGHTYHEAWKARKSKV